MKYILILLLLLIFLDTSCNSSKKPDILNELKEIEYNRQVNSKKISKWLENNDSEVRLKTAETLGRLQDSSKVITITHCLTDKDPEVRSATAFALGQLFTPRSEGFIIDGLKNESNKKVRGKLIEAFGKCGSNEHAFLMQDFIKGDDVDFQKNAAVSCGILAYQGFPPYSLTPSLAQLLKQSNYPEVQWRCVFALYRIGALRSLPDFIEALKSPESLVKFYALKGLGRISSLINAPEIKRHKKKTGVVSLIKTYHSTQFHRLITKQLNDSSWYVRIAALELLNEMGKAASQTHIIKKLKDSHLQVQIKAIQTLQNYLNKATLKEMQQIYRSTRNDWRLKGEALTVLAYLQPEQALKEVERSLINAPWPNNYYAIKTLASINKEALKKQVGKTARAIPKKASINKAIQLLTELSNHQSIAQTTFSLEVLATRPTPPKLSFFLEKLKTGDMAIATIVSTYLSHRNPKPIEAVQPLIEVYQKFTAPRDLEAMEPILTALDSIGSSEALPFLKAQLKNPYPIIQQKARKVLRNLTLAEHFEDDESDEKYFTKWDFPPLNPDSSYQIIFSTSRGDFIIKLDPKKAPVNTANIVSLVKKNFYNGIYFHRIVPGFVVQAGDPRGDGWGGSGYSVPCEYNDLFYERGVVGIPHAGKDTGSSQFFITHTPQPHLNGKYTAIGKVISGMEVIDKLMLFDQILHTKLIEN